MKTRCGTRLFRRLRRPAPLPVTRTQIRQKADRLRDINELEAVLELSRAKPDINYLLQLDLESSYLRDVLASIEGIQI
jgi:hypothetical protein